ncbi:hypothetical protein Taro_015025, partial [Colocasia esculenta]|nr:hypothetical protein [Colocasia esculenta]
MKTSRASRFRATTVWREYLDLFASDVRAGGIGSLFPVPPGRICRPRGDATEAEVSPLPPAFSRAAEKSTVFTSRDPVLCREYLAANFPGLVSLWAMLAGLLVEVAEVDLDPEGDLMWWQCRPPPCLLHFGVVIRPVSRPRSMEIPPQGKSSKPGRCCEIAIPYVVLDHKRAEDHPRRRRRVSRFPSSSLPAGGATGVARRRCSKAAVQQGWRGGRAAKRWRGGRAARAAAACKQQQRREQAAAARRGGAIGGGCKGQQGGRQWLPHARESAASPPLQTRAKAAA